MLRKWGIAQKGLILISVPVMFELCFLVIIGTALSQAQSELDYVSRSREIVGRGDDVGRMLVQSSALVTAYTITGRTEIKERFHQTAARVLDEYSALESLLNDDQVKLSNLTRLKAKTIHVFSMLDHLQPLSVSGSLQTLLMTGTAKEIGDESRYISGALRNLFDDEERITQGGAETRQRILNKLQMTLAVSILTGTAITGGLVFYFGRGISQRLKWTMENSARLAARAPLKQPLSGADEIAELDHMFHQAAHDLHELERIKRGLTVTIANRLQEPLRQVHQTVEQFLSGSFGDIDDRARDRLERTIASNQRLMRLLDDLRILERKTEGQFELNMQIVELWSILQSAAVSVEELAIARNITFRIERSDIHVIADRDRLIQVIVNLLSNAIKFSPDNGTISLRTIELPDRVQIFVCDQGRGISEEFQQKIFELFEQVEARDASEKGGSGLGLAICKNIIEGHGGSIQVQSKPGEGSTFIVCLPSQSAYEHNNSHRLRG